MRRHVLAIVLVVGLLTPANAVAAATARTATSGAGQSVPELVSMMSGMEGRTVRITGEVVSEALAGGDGHVWVNVLSEGVAIGVWIPREHTEVISRFGTYRHSGDIIEVVGVFHEACDLHGGDLDIHADQLDVITKGVPVEHPVSYWKIGLGASGILAARLIMRRRPDGQPA